MSEISLRFATPDDAEAIFKLVLALARYEKLEQEVVSSADHFREVLADANSGIEVLLAEREAMVVGFALYFGITRRLSVNQGSFSKICSSFRSIGKEESVRLSCNV